MIKYIFLLLVCIYYSEAKDFNALHFSIDLSVDYKQVAEEIKTEELDYSNIANIFKPTFAEMQNKKATIWVNKIHPEKFIMLTAITTLNKRFKINDQKFIDNFCQQMNYYLISQYNNKIDRCQTISVNKKLKILYLEYKHPILKDYIVLHYTVPNKLNTTVFMLNVPEIERESIYQEWHDVVLKTFKPIGE